ncbi:thioesterase domain-containing protein [Mucilaginibacter antarcticus]|uniref:thioesterase domain-containing protein n=1 Tax=Mucilaginibacter antarcticus TaxID=1855725 RepID=UPI003642B14C
MPINVVGDLYIGGVGVARGYANDPEKTNAAFIPDPFNKQAGGMMYKTGDLGKMMPDLNMKFIGRKDNQVKINGFRIELGEIENVLKSSELVANAVVLAKNDTSNNKVLICYIVWKDGRFEQERINIFLKNKLPGYMIPGIWIELEKLPLTSNGKIDRKSLMELDVSILLKEKVLECPGTPTEQTLFDIWKDALGLKVSGINDNFFELGGHSLMAVQMLAHFKKATNITFQLAVLYQYPDIISLAKFIDTSQNSFNYKFLVPIKGKGSKTPLYIVQGDSGNILNFSNIIRYIDRDQPVYGLKAIGLDGIHAPFEDLKDIAAHYITEIIQHNPDGPYLVAGYSSGAYVAVEIRKQMIEMGRDVQPLIIIDADAGMTEYKLRYKLIPKKIKRHYPKILNFLKSSLTQPSLLVKNNIFFKSFSHSKESIDSGFSVEQLREIKSKRERAFRNYIIEPFNDKVTLLKATISVHYIDQGNVLGWEQYAKKGVDLYKVTGDHFSILLPPHVEEFTTTLQGYLNKSGTELY